MCTYIRITTYKPHAATQSGADIPNVSTTVALAQATLHAAAETSFPCATNQFLTKT